jgi:NarL family two-component system sensor histidine kinase YdfH
VRELLSALLPVAGFTIFIAYFFNRQIEARVRMQFLLDELEEAHQQLTEYIVQVENLTLTNERQRMARELHDTLAQGLAGLILQLEAAVIHIEGQNTEKARQIVEQAMVRARTTLVDARKAIDDLRTDLSSPQALEEILTREVERFRSATGIPCEVQISLPGQVDTQLSEHILRTLTEGLWNIARHAQAKQASVRLHTINGQIEIEIEDDGIGFEPDEKVARSGNYGLLGIRERALLAGGRLKLDSEIGKGTRLRVSLPVNPLKEIN